ncbi:hypothetical protein EZ449_06465 [Pedobacter frigidisoli]|uniref:Uncharacterized protein n=1 Tax=Pedobacter frigidisoli TaxID=2530455 RepID=A0A4R0P2U1_9SPHI|nr:hypothetical protein [Pedobacter frigidisoli]TCD11134.1 hypothetical protein EZ449_06465 [Pedobacter frigidisoli]
MKFIFTLIVFLALSYCGFSQQKAKYKIKIIESNGRVSRGSFYAAADDGLTIIGNRKDTLKFSADSIVALHVQRKGFVAPLAIAGGLTFFVLAAKSDKLVESLVLIAAGVPVGVSAGSLIGGILGNRKHYKNLSAKDFPLIKPNLQQYTILK